MAKRLHPDMNQDRDTTAEFVELEVAYSCLSNAHSRHAYDQLLRFEREKVNNPALNRKHASTVRKRTTTRRKRATYHSNLSYEQYLRDEKYNTSLLGMFLKIVFLLVTSGIYFTWLGLEAEAAERQLEIGLEPDMPPMLISVLVVLALPVIIGLSYLYEPLVKMIIVGRPKKKAKK